MADETTELEQKVRAAAEALNREDFDSFLALVHPEVEFQSLIAEAEGQEFRGHEGVRQWWESIRGAFEAVSWDYEAVHTVENGGIARVRINATLGGVPVHQTMWQAVTLADGKARWWRFYRTEEEALAALSARDPQHQRS